MTQTSTFTQTDTDNLAALVSLDDRIASYRRKLSANRGSQKLSNERQEILNSLAAQRKGLCALLPLGMLVTYLADTHNAAMDHIGAGKALVFARRGDAIRELRTALVGRMHLTTMATDPDVLDIAQGTTTVAAVNQRHAEIDAEIAAEDAAADLAVANAVATFHQPTTGTAASPVATCTTCKRGISRMNGGSALWIDAAGLTSCTVKAPADRPTILADEAHVRIGGNAFRPIEITASDDNPSVTGRMLVSRVGAELLLRDLAAALGYSVGMVNAVRCERAEHGEQVHPLRDDCLHPHLI
jgi:hypothetical protein